MLQTFNYHGKSNFFYLLVSIFLMSSCGSHIAKTRTTGHPSRLSGTWKLTRANYNGRNVDIQTQPLFLKVYHDSIFSGLNVEKSHLVKTMGGVYRLQDTLYKETIRYKKETGPLIIGTTNFFSIHFVNDSEYIDEGDVQMASGNQSIPFHLVEHWERIGTTGKAQTPLLKKFTGTWQRVKGVYDGMEINDGLTLKVVDVTGFKNFKVSGNKLIKVTQGSFTLKDSTYHEKILESRMHQTVGSVSDFHIKFAGDDLFTLQGGVNISSPAIESKMHLYEIWQKVK